MCSQRMLFIVATAAAEDLGAFLLFERVGVAYRPWKSLHT